MKESTDENRLFDISLYDDVFFDWHNKYARNYSIKTMDWLMDTYKPNSVIDFGCGIGSYLESAYNKGCRNIKGFDIGGEFAKKYTPAFLHDFIEYRDCTLAITTDKKYDYVLSFETIEHIEPSGTEQFIKNMVLALSDNGLIIFTGAPPEQLGCGHINCREKAEWIGFFEKEGLVIDNDATKNISENWADIGCPDYIHQNLLCFKKIML